jgi:hypothetical protein
VSIPPLELVQVCDGQTHKRQLAADECVVPVKETADIVVVNSLNGVRSHLE